MRAPLPLPLPLLLLVLAATVACGEAPLAPAETPNRSVWPAPPPIVESSVRACLLLASCARPEDSIQVRDPGSCVARGLSLLGSDVTLGCVASARGCGEVDRCLGRDRQGDGSRLCAARPGALVFCDGERLVSCEGERPQVMNCAELGGTCREMRVASGILVRGCYSSKLCGDGAPTTRCAGESKVITCTQGLVEETRCASGTKCSEARLPSGEVEAQCRPTGKRPCVVGTTARCRGEVLVSCLASDDGRGAVVETDCRSAGLSCVGEGAGARGASCMARDTCELGAARCEGNDVRLCAAGVSVLARCDRWGLGPCRTENGAASCTGR